MDKKMIIVLSLTAIAAIVSLVSDAATNTVSVVDSVIADAESLIPEIRGNAIWDLLKFLFAWGVKLIPATFLLLIAVCSLFSQSIHVSLFQKGRRGLLWFSKVKTFGKRVRASDTKEYRKFTSPDREKIMETINAHVYAKEPRSNVFLIMGPSDVGKKLMVFAESKAKFVLVVDRDDWYDHGTVKEILKERTELLVKHLLPMFQKSVLIVLSWDANGPNIAEPLPSHERMQDIVKYLVGVLGESPKFRKVSFAMTIPAYYQVENISEENCGECNFPKEFSVAHLNCTECLSLLDAQLDYKVRDGVDKVKCRRDLDAKAREMGLTLERMVWIESIGMPRQVVRVVSRQQYDSSEVWGSLHDWWAQVYGQDDGRNDCGNGRNDWFAFLYVLALKSLSDDGPVNAEECAMKLFGANARSVDRAIELMCVNRRPRSDNGDNVNSAILLSQKPRRAKAFDLRKVDPELIFEDAYVIECLVGSLGIMNSEAGRPIFTCGKEMRQKVQEAFNLKDKSECEKIATAYLSTTERFSDLAVRLTEQYELLDGLKSAFGICKLVEAYERRLKNPIVFAGFVREVISRVGALTAALLDDMLEKINETLLNSNSTSDYVRLTFEMLPVYIISDWSPHVWSVNFKLLSDEMARPDVEDDVKFKCAAMICVAQAEYSKAVALGGQIFLSPEIKNHGEIIRQMYLKVSGCVNNEVGNWSFLKQMLPVIDTMGIGCQLPKFDIGALDSEVRMTWLSICCDLMRYHSPLTDSAESMEIIDAISEGLNGLDLVENDRMLVRFCRSLMPYWRDFDIELEDGVNGLKQDIKELRQELDQWSDCPIIAVNNFACLCDDYEFVCCNGGRKEMWDASILWEIHKFLLDWRRGMSDIEYSRCLSIFARLLCGMSTCEFHVGLRNIWADVAERVKEFWKPILSGEKACEDWTMPRGFFSMYSSLSNVKTIPATERCQLLTEIYPSMYVYEGNLDFIDSAWNVYHADSDLVPPHIKMFWIAQILAGREADYWLDDSAEMIRIAQELIQEARDNGRKVDEELVRLIYEANGLPTDSPIDGDKSGKRSRG